MVEPEKDLFVYEIQPNFPEDFDTFADSKIPKMSDHIMIKGYTTS